jgi:CO/xanthine dehydrogenase Mo-binding subunit
VWFPDLLYVRFLTSPHPHARILDIDTAAAEKMPGVRHILTYKNAPKLQRPNVARGRILPEPMPRELNLQGEAVALVAAETEDLAQDAADAIKVEFEVLPFASTLKDSMAADAPDLGHGKGNLIRHANSPKDFPRTTWADQRGDIERTGRSGCGQRVHLPFFGRRIRSHAAERQRSQMGWRPAYDVGHGPRDLSGTGLAGGGTGH